MIEIIKLRQYEQPDGKIVPVELWKELPFKPERLFYITDVPFGKVRGDHAHKLCEQIIIPVCGSFVLSAERFVDGELLYFEQTMVSKNEAAYIKPFTWLRLTKFTPNTVCLVLASDPYDSEDYINDFEDFTRLAGSVQRPQTNDRAIEGKNQGSPGVSLG